MATCTRLCTQISEKLAQYRWDIRYVYSIKCAQSGNYTTKFSPAAAVARLQVMHVDQMCHGGGKVVSQVGEAPQSVAIGLFKLGSSTHSTAVCALVWHQQESSQPRCCQPGNNYLDCCCRRTYKFSFRRTYDCMYFKSCLPLYWQLDSLIERLRWHMYHMQTIDTSKPYQLSNRAEQ